MKLNEYINLLTQLLNEHGNLEVKYGVYPQCNIDTKIAHMRIPKDSRQTAIKFWDKYIDYPKQKGEKVIKL